MTPEELHDQKVSWVYGNLGCTTNHKVSRATAEWAVAQTCKCNKCTGEGLEPKPLTEEQVELLMQLPDEDYHDVYCGEGEPAEEFHYPLSHDEVLVVPISTDEHVAKLKLTRTTQQNGYTKIGETYYTGRFCSG